MDLKPENKSLLLIFGESLFLTSVTKYTVENFSAWDERVGNTAGRGDEATYELAIFDDFNPCAELIQVQRTKKHFPSMMPNFIPIRKLTKKDEPAVLSLY